VQWGGGARNANISEDIFAFFIRRAMLKGAHVAECHLWPADEASLHRLVEDVFETYLRPGVFDALQR
jgi:hypothetical protein